VFADAARAHPLDFVWGDAANPPAYGDRAGTFPVTAPIPDAFEAGASFPHPEGLLPAESMVVGETRFAFFVGEGHFGGPPDGFAVPAPASAFASGVLANDVITRGSVFAAGPDPLAPAAKIGFAWQEREPFAVRVWLPQFFGLYDPPPPAGASANSRPPLSERLRRLLDRHRAAGIHVYVCYADDRWSLGSGVLRDTSSADPLGTVISGTALWPDGTPQPDPASLGSG
jgi:hypothetical protein